MLDFYLAMEQRKSPVDYLKETAENYINTSQLGGIVLLAATAIALILANSPWKESFHHFWEMKFMVGFAEGPHINRTVHTWINDGLMMIFFMVAGMELKRAFLVGELSHIKKASMPLLAAFGGMLVPALIFFFFNEGTENVNGWGIPMATDIAYSLGLISLLGKSVSGKLRSFLISLSIVDDMGAILVIAIFYSSGIQWLNLGIAAGILGLLFLFNRLNINRLSFYAVAGVALWLAFLDSGIHPTIAGVLFAFTLPVKPKMDTHYFKKQTEKDARELDKTDLENNDVFTSNQQKKVVKHINKETKKARPVLLRLENKLSPVSSFIIIPLFALSNAGITFSSEWTSVFTNSVGLGIIIGLAAGKVTGISLFSFLSEKLKIAKLPAGQTWKQIIGVGLIGGVGFTMSLFITNLAFTDQEQISTAKISILIGSFIAAVSGLLVLKLAGKKAEEE